MMLKIRQMTFIRRGASEDYIPSSLSKWISPHGLVDLGL
jgi:hypothetical protein